MLWSQAKTDLLVEHTLPQNGRFCKKFDEKHV